MSTSKETLATLLSGAGISVGPGVSSDICVLDDRFYHAVLGGGSLGLGESYMQGLWESGDLEETLRRMIVADLGRTVRHRGYALRVLFSKLMNAQTKLRSRKVAEAHYDIGNDVYTSFLDPYNQYTCGYFKDTDDLAVAQQKKLELICRKLRLRKEDRVLDIGCGWGGFSRYAAEHYGCTVTGITISTEQKRYAEEFCKGLPVTVRLLDYRDLTGTYDKVLICGMIEHVGYKNYATLMAKVRDVLSDTGLFLLHTIGRNTSATLTDPWIAKYIFPNSQLPSLRQLLSAAEGRFVLEDLENFGVYYAKTLRAWNENFERNWENLKSRYDERFRRMFRYYFLSCAAAFEARSIQLWQFVFAKKGIAGGYVRPLA